MSDNIRFHQPFEIKESNKDILSLLRKKKKSIFGFDYYTNKNKKKIKQIFKFNNIHFTNSCSSALEMSALLTFRKEKNEVLVPSYTFVTSASSFVRAGFSVKFLDISNSNMMPSLEIIKKAVTQKTGVLVLVHYAGMSVENLDEIKIFCKKNKIYLVEDAAQALGSKYKEKYLGSFGDLSCFSFHETKNIHCGSGGILVINNLKFLKKSFFILERGTDRHLVLKNQKKKYSWITLGSSFNMTELNSAYLNAQISNYKKVIIIRKKLFKLYLMYFNKYLLKNYFDSNVFLNYPFEYNYHCIFIVLKKKSNFKLLKFLSKNKIQAFIGYVPLHNSPFGKKVIGYKKLKMTEKFQNRVVRLPLHTQLKSRDVKLISQKLRNFFYNDN